MEPESQGPGTTVCVNHPIVPTTYTCPDCGRHFCPDCLVVHEGRSVCAGCRQAALERFERTRLKPEWVVLAARLFCGYMLLTALVAGAIGMVRTAQAMREANLAAVFGLVGLLAPAVGGILALGPLVFLGPGRRWTYLWFWGTAIAGTMLSCAWANCFAAPLWLGAVPLLWFWSRPEVREYCEEAA